MFKKKLNLLPDKIVNQNATNHSHTVLDSWGIGSQILVIVAESSRKILVIEAESSRQIFAAGFLGILIFNVW